MHERGHDGPHECDCGDPWETPPESLLYYGEDAEALGLTLDTHSPQYHMYLADKYIEAGGEPPSV